MSTTAADTIDPITPSPSMNLTRALAIVSKDYVNSAIPEFRVGDTIRVQVKIVEGTKERIQAFQGVVIKRSKRNQPDATFTVRKVSFNIGVERTFPLHSKRITIEPVSSAKVRRARLFYLRPLRGKATRLKTQFVSTRSEESSTLNKEKTDSTVEG